MTLARLATLVLLLLVAGLGSAPFDVEHGSERPSLGGAEVSHIAGISCPDPGEDGHPCGPTCPCLCCPRRPPSATVLPVLVAAPASVRPPIGGPTSGEEPESVRRDDFHPKNVLSRIFRPPRA
jgi:hypothetical protein